MVYEDRLTGMRAKHFYDNLVEGMEDECDFDLELWNFRLLPSSEVGNLSTQLTARADFVILSLRGNLGLTTEIKSWVEMWSRLTANRNAALIVLINKPRSKDSAAASTLAYLRNIAARRGISFFAHTAFSQAKN